MTAARQISDLRKQGSQTIEQSQAIQALSGVLRVDHDAVNKRVNRSAKLSELIERTLVVSVCQQRR